MLPLRTHAMSATPAPGTDARVCEHPDCNYPLPHIHPTPHTDWKAVAPATSGDGTAARVEAREIVTMAVRAYSQNSRYVTVEDALIPAVAVALAAHAERIRGLVEATCDVLIAYADGPYSFRLDRAMTRLQAALATARAPEERAP